MKNDTTLLAVFQTLSDIDQSSVLSYAQFLASRSIGTQKSGALPATTQTQQPSKIEPLPEPNLIPRPETESVIQAIKRLSSSYPMLNKKTMLGVTSDMLMKHIVHGEEAKDVIDELEGVFQKSYSELKDQTQ